MLALVLADRLPQDRDRMLRENFFRVRTEVEQQTNGLFYMMPYERQEQLINDKIQDLIGSIQFRGTEEVEFELT